MRKELLEGLDKYLTAREGERIDDVDEAWAALSPREQLLVREAAVMGFFLGNRSVILKREDYPKDSDVITRVLMAARSYDDLYPTLATLGKT